MAYPRAADKTRLWTRRSFRTLRNLSSVRRHMIGWFRHGSQRGPAAAAAPILLLGFWRRREESCGQKTSSGSENNSWVSATITCLYFCLFVFVKKWISILILYLAWWQSHYNVILPFLFYFFMSRSAKVQPSILPLTQTLDAVQGTAPLWHHKGHQFLSQVSDHTSLLLPWLCVGSTQQDLFVFASSQTCGTSNKASILAKGWHMKKDL